MCQIKEKNGEKNLNPGFLPEETVLLKWKHCPMMRPL